MVPYASDSAPVVAAVQLPTGSHIRCMGDLTSSIQAQLRTNSHLFVIIDGCLMAKRVV